VASTSVRLGPYTLSAIIAVVSLVAAAVSRGRISAEAFLIGGLCLISVGVWHQCVWPVMGGATALATATLATAATTPFKWEIDRPLPVTVHVVDAETGEPICSAVLAAVNDGDEIVADRSRTDTRGYGTLIVPFQMKLQGTLYEVYCRPRFKIADLGWQVEVTAGGYQTAVEPLADSLPNEANSVDLEFEELTIALKRRSE